MKVLTGILAFSTLLLSVSTYINYERVETRNKVISDREKVITGYQKVIAAIGRTGSIDVQKLETELKKDFDLSDEAGYYDNKDHYFVMQPKDNKINKHAIWDFMGRELVLDKDRKFKTVTLHKL